jgi:hypothetical protein
MAEIFHARLAINGSAGAWVALPALASGIDPMRRICIRGEAAFEVGHCTAGGTARDAGTLLSSGSGMGFHCDLGVVNYNKITARSQGSSTNLYILTFAATDDGPMGF